MATNDILIIERWLKHTKIAESRLGLLAAANPRAIERIRDGTAQISTLNKVMAYIQAHPKG